MTTISTDQRLGDIVTARPALARELERRGLDYCCGGSATLAEACTDVGLDATSTAAEFESLVADEEPATWSTMGVVQLVDHLESTHHAYLTDELPLLSELCAKVDSVHGANHPELADIRTAVEDIRADLEPHLTMEEQRLFPTIRELAVSRSPSAARGSVEQPISMMLLEHDVVGKLLAHLRDLTDGYVLPDDACVSYASLFDRLQTLEADTHLHIHKENNLLAPMVIRLERRCPS